MKKKLILLRNTPFINRIFRAPLRFLILFNSKKLIVLASRFRPYGKTRISYCGEQFYIYSEADDNKMSELYYLNEWELNEGMLLKKLAQQSKTFFDVGANTGIHSIMTATCNNQLKVVAFEPHPNNYRRLSKNIVINHLDNIEAIENAVGQHAGKIKFTIPEDNSISDVSSATGEFTSAYYQITYKDIEVNQTDLDTFIAARQLYPDFIKIDVEYYELHVLQGMKNFLESHSPVILMEIFVIDFLHATKPVLKGKIDPDYSLKIERFMKELGYYFYMPCKYGLFRVDSIITSPDHTNYLFIKQRSENRYLLYDSDELTQLLTP